MKYLWLDDERPVSKTFNGGNAEIATTYEEAIDIILDINDGKDDICINFDHDLAAEKTGYDLAKWLVEHKITGYFDVHSMNPIGRFNIIQLLEHYGWKRIYFIS